MRIVAHHPRQYADKGASLPQAEKDMLFSMSLKMIEYDNLGQTTKSIRGYLWHINVYLQVESFIYLLGELRHRLEGEEVDRAWQQVSYVFKNHPEMITNTKNSLFVAIGNLALKAWEKRSGALGLSQGSYHVATPEFITILRSQRKPKSTRSGNSVSNTQRSDSVDRDTYMSPPIQGDGFQVFEIPCEFDPAYLPTYPSMDSSPMDWEYWQGLMDGNDLSMLNDHRGL